MEDLLDNFEEVRECDYKGEHYSVRDNGAVMRHGRPGKRVRKDDSVWTFGVRNEENGIYDDWHSPRSHYCCNSIFWSKRFKSLCG